MKKPFLIINECGEHLSVQTGTGSPVPFSVLSLGPNSTLETEMDTELASEFAKIANTSSTVEAFVRTTGPKGKLRFRKVREMESI